MVVAQGSIALTDCRSRTPGTSMPPLSSRSPVIRTMSILEGCSQFDSISPECGKILSSSNLRAVLACYQHETVIPKYPAFRFGIHNSTSSYVFRIF